MEKQKQVKLVALQGIELVFFSIMPSSFDVQPAKSFEFKIGQETKINSSKRLIIVFTTIAIVESGQRASLANLELACGFTLNVSESRHLKDKAGNYLISSELNSTLNRISIATTRGVLYTKLRGSYLQDLTLPILDMEV